MFEPIARLFALIIPLIPILLFTIAPTVAPTLFIILALALVLLTLALALALTMQKQSLSRERLGGLQGLRGSQGSCARRRLRLLLRIRYLWPMASALGSGVTEASPGAPAMTRALEAQQQQAAKEQ